MKNKQGGFIKFVVMIVVVVIILLIMRYNHITITGILKYFHLTWSDISNWFQKAIVWFKDLFNSVK